RLDAMGVAPAPFGRLQPFEAQGHTREGARTFNGVNIVGLIPGARVADRYVVVTAGGGGIPVVRQPDGRLHGVEAVIDKDLTAALLARSLDADVLVIATDVDHAKVGFGTPAERDLGRVRLSELRDIAAAGEFASGSMGPKVEAVTRFVAAGGPRGVITSLTHITDAVDGSFGTVVEPD
ncbi:MAG: hypothetical protein IE926_18280, partial [Micrococcales bacterium]|nr:hypothetical protein [Micrococcales bacterium]